MNLLYYEEKFSSLNMNANRPGPKSPHKVALLLAVTDLIENGQIQDNKILFDDQLKSAFTKRFQELGTKIDHALLQQPYFHLRSEGFWRHEIKSGRKEAYSELKRGRTEKNITENIQYAYLDDELFEYLGYTFARELLRAALHRNLLPDEETLAIERDQWEWPKITRNWGLLVDTPPPESQTREAKSPSYTKARKIDYEERDRINRDRGYSGEKLVLINEIIKLGDANRHDLIRDIEWTSQKPGGDREGYDIRSFSLPKATELFIEVKTTSGNDRTPFFITDNEVKFSKREAARYQLHRVYNFNKMPKRFMLDGAIDRHRKIDLLPKLYQAKLK